MFKAVGFLNTRIHHSQFLVSEASSTYFDDVQHMMCPVKGAINKTGNPNVGE